MVKLKHPIPSNSSQNTMNQWCSKLTNRWKAQDPENCEKLRILAILMVVIVTFSVFASTGSSRNNLGNSRDCDFPAIFNFGDSNSDTGGKSAAFHRLAYPNGISFFGNQSGRYCDGRIILDYVAEKLRLPYVSAYLDSMGTNFKNGANFATGGSTIQPVDSRIFKLNFSAISLDIQILQFEQFKERSVELYTQGKTHYVKKNLPAPEVFSRALYTFDIGQNDLDAGFKSMTEKQVVESIPGILDRLAQAVQKLYQLQARVFWIHNTGPIGCLPVAVILFPPKPENLDQNGCIKSQNKVAQEFNKHLKDKVSQLQKQLSDAVFTYIDTYTAKYSLISEAKKLGFANPLGYCCGVYGNYRVGCGKKMMVNGTVISGDVCRNPEQYISWDGIHYSQAANERVAHRILDGSLSDPPKPINDGSSKTYQRSMSQVYWFIIMSTLNRYRLLQKERKWPSPK